MLSVGRCRPSAGTPGPDHGSKGRSSTVEQTALLRKREQGPPGHCPKQEAAGCMRRDKLRVHTDEGVCADNAMYQQVAGRQSHTPGSIARCVQWKHTHNASGGHSVP
eukprot:753299-Pelagomonas_calceolata.AAC.1